MFNPKRNTALALIASLLILFFSLSMPTSADEPISIEEEMGIIHEANPQYSEEKKTFEVGAWVGMFDHYLQANGAAQKGSVLQGSVKTKHLRSGLYCFVWWSAPVDTEELGENFNTEVDFSCGTPFKGGTLEVQYFKLYGQVDGKDIPSILNFSFERKFGKPVNNDQPFYAKLEAYWAVHGELFKPGGIFRFGWRKGDFDISFVRDLGAMGFGANTFIMGLFEHELSGWLNAMSVFGKTSVPMQNEPGPKGRGVETQVGLKFSLF